MYLIINKFITDVRANRPTLMSQSIVIKTNGFSKERYWIARKKNELDFLSL